MGLYKLVNRRGRTVNMKDGEPFLYTTEWTARLGKKFLEQKRKEKLRVVTIGE